MAPAYCLKAYTFTHKKNYSHFPRQELLWIKIASKKPHWKRNLVLNILHFVLRRYFSLHLTSGVSCKCRDRYVTCITFDQRQLLHNKDNNCIWMQEMDTSVTTNIVMKQKSITYQPTITACHSYIFFPLWDPRISYQLFPTISMLQESEGFLIVWFTYLTLITNASVWFTSLTLITNASTPWLLYHEIRPWTCRLCASKLGRARQRGETTQTYPL